MNYFPEKQVLRITYVSGMIYDYLNVPEQVYLDMKNAFSKGTYLNKHVKQHYNFEKVKG